MLLEKKRIRSYYDYSLYSKFIFDYAMIFLVSYYLLLTYIILIWVLKDIRISRISIFLYSWLNVYNVSKNEYDHSIDKMNYSTLVD